MMMSSKGYAILWNNYGMTEFNPCSNHVQLEAVKQSEDSKGEVVDVTTTTGNRRELRRQHSYSATINVRKQAITPSSSMWVRRWLASIG